MVKPGMSEIESTTGEICTLCGLGNGRHPFTGVYGGEEKRFCCLGCRNVYAILVESGVVASGQEMRETEIFRQSLALGLISQRDSAAEDGSAWTTGIPAGTPTTETLLQVTGMWCSSCAWLIEHALREERGVVRAEANFAADLVRVTYCPQYLPAERIGERIRGLGYQTSEYLGESETASAEKRDLLLRLGVAAFFWMNIMTLSTALYVGYFEQIAESVRRYMPFLLMVLALPVVFYAAWPILRLAWKGALNLTVRMETLLALGILAAFGYSTIQAFTGGDHVYFDTASAIVTLVLLGKLIERNAKDRTVRAIGALYRMMPKKARLLVDGHERFVTVEALEIGAVFLVKAGERIPADGVVISGSSHTDESLLTGEVTPVARTAGEAVIAGSINLSGVLEVRATKVGAETTLARIIQLVEKALSSKSPLERTVDRISRVFVPVVVLIAVTTFLVCWQFEIGSPGEAPADALAESLMRAITILVIACPCALGMATPLAVTAAIGTASQMGILVSDSLVLETIRRISTVVFDKTGTITRGRFAVVETMTAGTAQFAEVALPRLATLEQYSEHPLGRALVAHARESGIIPGVAEGIEIHQGLGVTGLVDGTEWLIGNRRLFETRQIEWPAELISQAVEWERTGRTVTFYGCRPPAGHLVPGGIIAFGDTIHPEAAALMAALASRGIETLIVSGDSEASTAWTCREVGADGYHAEALPSDKIRIISERQRQGKIVAMVGDGINDAPALAQADLGLAVGSGTEVAMKAAAVVLMTSSLSRIMSVFDLAAQTWRIVRQNLFWAFFYNTLAIGLAITGILNPILAAGAMLLSSISVIGNSMRLSKPASR
jgi:heavy metal translocating P-type ATPase